MADNIKEQERAELHRAIWNIANDLRGSVDVCLLMDYIEKYPGKVIQNLWLMGVSFEDIRELAVEA